MRSVCRLSVCVLLLCFFTGAAHATKINILDPFTTNGITSSPFAVGFDACSSDELPRGTTGSPLGCFAGVNYTGDSWTGIELTLHDPTQSFSFQCNTESRSTELFASATCGYDPTTGDYDLLFSAGGVPENGFFVITEDDLLPGALTFTATVTYANGTGVTPEPSAAMLLSTGLLCMGCVVLVRRREQTS